MRNSLKFIDLFAGLGGFHLALSHLGCQCVFASELKEDLQKLYRENLSNLFPHPLYSGFHYSHPTLTERERAIHAKDHISKNH